MKTDSLFLTAKSGLTVEFRSAREEEARLMIDYLRQVCGESRFLLSAAEDVKFKEEGERAFLKSYEDNPKALMLNAYIDGQLVGNGSFTAAAYRPRLAHRAELSIALFDAYCSRGIGELLMGILIEKARECGYELAELECYAENRRAINLYHKLGFVDCGLMKKGVKYEDGSYADLITMQMDLQ